MAETTLEGLQLGQGTVASYAVHFCHLTADMEWNEAAQLYQFRWGLWEIKDKLAHIETPTGLDNLMDPTIYIDNQLQEQREEK